MKKYLLVMLLLFIIKASAQDDPDYPSSPSASNIIAAEYFIDADPGFGNATSISATAGLNLSNVSASINTSGLSNGVHRIYLRSKNANGQWSITNVQSFIVDYNPDYPAAPAAAQNITAAEYFIDADPGFGNATSISITQGLDLNNVVASINTSSLSNGMHHIYLRSKNAYGQWSITNVQSFIVDYDPAYPTAPTAAQNITAAEYFVDADPGFGNATPISITPGLNLSNITASINTLGLSNGVHRAYLRTRSADGKWSIVNEKDFTIDIDPAYPGAPHTPGNIKYVEYFFDTDPGFGNANSVSITPGVNLNNISFNANTSSLADGNHVLYIRSLDDWSITSANNFVVGSVTPLHLLSFIAQINRDKITLLWKTENEINTSHFDIERSADGTSFESIGNVSASNTAGGHSYNFDDSHPLNGISYYRLNEVDIDGKSILSQIVQVNTITQTNGITISPNPARNIITIRNLKTEDITSLRVITLNGNEVMRFSPISTLQYDVSRLSAGIYYLRIIKKNGAIQSVSFIKQ
ncbi:MAG: T9SS type A sorting domain-containing protein [Arachidicoccus sp.]|nr:T9SS type A sorting domain-containing protein [Arachidicoccus sp.]